jgi:hypothetical protein
MAKAVLTLIFLEHIDVGQQEVEADRQLCVPKISMLIPALAITDFIEEIEADRQLCAPKISMLILALTITNFIEEVEADRDFFYEICYG